MTLISTKTIIGNPVSPCKPISFKSINCLKVTVFKPGGMGGGTTEHFGDIEEPVDGMRKFKSCINNLIQHIGNNFIISIKPVTLYKQVTDTKAHANYNRVTCNSRTLTRWFEEPEHSTIKYVDKVNTDTIKPLLQVVDES
jgi:hypothetical protein